MLGTRFTARYRGKSASARRAVYWTGLFIRVNRSKTPWRT